MCSRWLKPLFESKGPRSFTGSNLVSGWESISTKDLALTPGLCNGLLAAATRAEFVVDMAHVGAYGIDADHQLISDTFIALPVIDSAVKTDDQAQFVTSAATFYIKQVGIDAQVVELALFTVGQAARSYVGRDGFDRAPFLWLPVEPEELKYGTPGQ